METSQNAWARPTVAEPVAERKGRSEDAVIADFGGVAQLLGGEFLMGSSLMRIDFGGAGAYALPG